MRRDLLGFALGLCACSALAACGYRPLDARAQLASDAGTIAIALFESSTPEVGLERLLADALHEEFERRGDLRPVYAPAASADLLLEGSVREIQVSSDAFSSVALTLEDEVSVWLDVAIRRPDGEVLLRRQRWRFAERFLASADPQVYESNKERALRRLSSRVASRLHDELYQTR